MTISSIVLVVYLVSGWVKGPKSPELATPIKPVDYKFALPTTQARLVSLDKVMEIWCRFSTVHRFKRKWFHYNTVCQRQLFSTPANF